jgi:hypothetical protein
MRIENITPNMKNRHAHISFMSMDYSQHAQINLNFDIRFTGNETLNDANEMIKTRALQLLQEAIPLLFTGSDAH